jgi:aspartate kinase
MSTIPKSSHPTLVMKFGGTSVGTPEAMAQAAQIVLSAHPDWPRLVVVSSALAGVTNLLLRSATRAAEGDSETYTQAVDELRERHFNIIDKLVAEEARQQQTKQEIVGLIENFRSLCQAIAVLGEASPRALDAVAALGERMSVRLFSAAVESAGLMAPFVEATRLIITDSFFQSAHPDMDVTKIMANRQ